MDELVLSYRGLDLVKATEDHVDRFVPNLSPGNIREFAELYELDPHDSLKNMLHSDGVNYAVLKDGEPLAMTGLYPDEPCPVMWAMFHKDLRKHWIKFARASQQLIAYYHQFSPKIACEVWDQNEDIHYWLAALGFEPELHFQFGKSNKGVVRFTRVQVPTPSIYTQQPRPVIH